MSNPFRLRVILRPGLVLPLLLSAALLAVALSLGDLDKVLDRVRSIPPWVPAFVLAMAIVYLAIKCWQLHLLLKHVSLHPGWRRLLLAFSVGELALTLPLGIFAQNWMLSATATDASRFGLSSAATVVMLLAETLVVLLFLVLVGIPHWPRLQPVAALFAIGLLGFGYLACQYGHLLQTLPDRAHRRVIHKALSQLSDLVRGLQHIHRPHLLAMTLLSTCAYLSALATAFWLVGRHLGISNLDFLAAATIYAFSLAIVLMFGGLLSQVGLLEILGIAAAQAWGLGVTDGLALMLGFRLLWTGALWLLCLPLVMLLWRRV